MGKSSRRKRMELADPVTAAAMEAAHRAGRDRYDDKLQEIASELKALVAGRDPRSLAGEDAVKFLAIKARFDAVAIQEKRFVEADLARRLDPRCGSETVEA